MNESELKKAISDINISLLTLNDSIEKIMLLYDRLNARISKLENLNKQK